MKALRFHSPALMISDVSVPDVPDEALIRVHRAGICATDIAVTFGYAAFSGTLGHEFVGTVERCADHEWLGKRVVGEINVGCGDCRWCNQGDSRHCALRGVLGIRKRDGVMAEFVSLPTRNLHVVPDHLTNRQAVFIEPLAAAFRILEHVRLAPDMKLILLGDGKLAQLIGRVLVASGLKPLMVGKHQNKLKLAQAAGIATRELAGIKADQTFRHAADVVIEATGRREGFAQALDLVSPLGTVVLKSTFHGDWAFDPQTIVVPEVTLVGSRCGRFAPAVELLASGRIEVDSLVTSEFPLSDGIAAFTAAQNATEVKVQICM